MPHVAGALKAAIDWPLSQDGAGSQPSRFRKKVGRDGGGVFKPFPRRQILRVWFVLIRPVNEQRLSDEVFAGSQSPKPTVIAVVTIISHEEEVIGRNADWTEVITPSDFLGVDVDNVRLVDLAVINEKDAVTQFQRLAGKSNNALHKTNIRIFRGPQRNDIASMDDASG